MISLKEREQAEQARSARDASRTEHNQLLTPPSTVARYRAPLETTAFPLEYSFHLLGDVRGKTVLEYGCGDGLNTVILATHGAKVIALDISAELLAVAKQRLEVNGCEGVELLLGSAHDLPLKDSSIDIVFGMAILHHLDLEPASREVRRVLKNDGRAIFQEPVRNSKLVNYLRQFFPKHSDVSPFERPLTHQEIEEFAASRITRARGFKLVFSSIASFFPLPRNLAIRASAHIDKYLLSLFPALRPYATIKVFEMIKKVDR